MNNENKIKDCAVIVSSCDAYQDVWHSFFVQFFKYWPDCPFQVYLISNNLKYEDERVKMVNIGDDKGWATNMRNALKIINVPYFIYLLEDIPFKRKVNTERILRLFEIIKKEKAAYLRLYPSPGPDFKYKDYKEVGKISENAPYRTSLMAAFWDNKIFNSLLIDGENAWEMELKGTERSRKIIEPFLSVKLSPILRRNNNPAIDYFCTAIKKGGWFYDAVRFLEKEGVEIDKGKRPIETYDNYIKRKIKQIPIIGIFFRKIFEIKNNLW